MTSITATALTPTPVLSLKKQSLIEMDQMIVDAEHDLAVLKKLRATIAEWPTRLPDSTLQAITQ